jgi:hypothetical protein
MNICHHCSVPASCQGQKKNADLTSCSSQMQPSYQKVDYSGHALDPRVIAPSDRDAAGCCSLEMFPQAFRRPVRSAAHWLDTGFLKSGDGDERPTLLFYSSFLRCYADSCDYAGSTETWNKMLQIWRQAGGDSRDILQATGLDPPGRNSGTHTTGLQLEYKPRISRVRMSRDNVLLTLSAIVSINAVTCWYVCCIQTDSKQ